MARAYWEAYWRASGLCASIAYPSRQRALGSMPQASGRLGESPLPVGVPRRGTRPSLACQDGAWRQSSSRQLMVDSDRILAHHCYTSAAFCACTYHGGTPCTHILTQPWRPRSLPLLSWQRRSQAQRCSSTADACDTISRACELISVIWRAYARMSKPTSVRRSSNCQLEAGITKAKTATLAEVDMVVRAGGRDVVLAYSLVGPNIAHAVTFARTHPQVTFAALTDDLEIVRLIDAEAARQGITFSLYVDINPGMDRTGIALGAPAARLARAIHQAPHLHLSGLHMYDGHILGDFETALTAMQSPYAALQDAHCRPASERLSSGECHHGGLASVPASSETFRFHS